MTLLLHRLAWGFGIPTEGLTPIEVFLYVDKWPAGGVELNMPTDVRAFVAERIEAMAKAPNMWAATREGFVMQLVVLLEVLGDKQAKDLIPECFPVSGNVVVGLEDPLYNHHAEKAISAAKVRLSALKSDVP